MPQYVVCLSVCPSVCDVQVPWSHRLEYFENNFTAENLKVPARIDPNMGDPVQRHRAVLLAIALLSCFLADSSHFFFSAFFSVNLEKYPRSEWNYCLIDVLSVVVYAWIWIWIWIWILMSMWIIYACQLEWFTGINYSQVFWLGVHTAYRPAAMYIARNAFKFMLIIIL